MTDEELISLASSVLMELRRRWDADSLEKLLYCQGQGVLITDTEGTPLDRREWLYLPFLHRISGHFQPVESESGRKCYTVRYEKLGHNVIVSQNGRADRFIVDTSTDITEISDSKGLILKGRVRRIA